MAAISREEARSCGRALLTLGSGLTGRAGGAPLTTQPGTACICSYWSSGHMFLPLKVLGHGFAVNLLIYRRALLALQLKCHIVDLAAGLSGSG